MTYAAGAPVTVGVDGSPASLDAVAWAAAEAGRRGRSLNLVYANAWPTYAHAMWPAWGPPDGRDGRTVGREVLRDAALRASEAAPHTAVTTEIVDGGPAGVLLERAEESALVVVGRRGSGGFPHLLVGSVAAQVATYAASPVVVVPERSAPPADDGPGIVLGVDGSEASHGAVEYAFAEASLRALPLTALRSWYWPTDDPAIVEPHAPLAGDHIAEQQRVLSEALAGWSEKYPDVRVRPLIAHHRPARALLDAAEGAALLVVGARGSGGFRTLLLGSVGETVIRHAPCPVVIVRAPARD
ncbi:universal stress protein [Cryptosporangium aurantiacum]|uniref:Nucleotide-binding universal stress protein, UspA family n=1 Tax=Cryptosporangium aurantiacum TaxID=134849 RepID=A0A1M7TZ35_9ACTN|nr:universal stress protein [Cryptosporangium aurantiacum]SHN75947.1 Nucleotide-binding universal stress protein, UspA family [Cryptosporangium aurantiacum]